MGFSVCVSSEATCSSLFSLLPSLRPSRLRPIPSMATMVLSHTPMAMPLLAFLSDPPLDSTPSPRDWTLCPRELFPLPTTTARGPLMLRLIPITLEDTLLPVSLLATHLARTPSPRASMPPPRDPSPTPTDTLATATWDTTTARGLLMLRPIPTTSVATLFPTLPTVLLPPLSPSDPPLAWTPSPRALTPPPRDTLPTPTATSATTTVKFRELTRRVC